MNGQPIVPADAGVAPRCFSVAFGPARLHSALEGTEPQMNRGATPILTTALLLVLASGCSAARPLHRSEASIRASLLSRTPLGSSRPDVEKFIRSQGWRVEPVKDPPLPGWKQPVVPVMPPFGRVGQPPVPEQTRSMIKADFGTYAYFVGTCYVDGWWAFDATDRLVQVWVNKSRDGL